MSSTITLTGRLTADPELRFSPSGVAVASFTVVTSRRVKDQNSGEWSDADTTYWDCAAFKQLAENVGDSLHKGMEVLVVGRVVQESWEDRQTGGKRSKLAVRVDGIGPSLRGVTAVVTKNGGRAEAYRAASAASSREGREDPWTSVPGGGQGQPAAAGWGGGDEAPF